jgi:3-phosphoglycerate kinase
MSCFENVRFTRRRRTILSSLRSSRPTPTYVNDAFCTACRAHGSTQCPSTSSPPLAFPSPVLDYLDGAVKEPSAAPSSLPSSVAPRCPKISVIESMLNKVDASVLGGAWCSHLLSTEVFPCRCLLVETPARASPQAREDRRREGRLPRLCSDVTVVVTFAPMPTTRSSLLTRFPMADGS